MANTNPPDPGRPPWASGPYPQPPSGPPSGPYPQPFAGPPPGQPPPGGPWQPPQSAPNRSRTAGIIIAVVAVVVLLGGGAAALVFVLPGGTVLAEPADPCPGIEDGIDTSYSPEEPEKSGYATCVWTLTDPDAPASGSGSDYGASTESMQLTVDYEVISEPVGGAAPEEIAGFLMEHNREKLETDFVSIKDEEEVADLGDEAHHLYTVYSTEGYETGASTMQIRRANVLITVDFSGGRGEYESMKAVGESELRPIVDDVSEAALRQLETRPA